MSCKSQKVLPQKEINESANAYLAKSAVCHANADSTLYLCVADDDPSMDPLRKVYVVYDEYGKMIMDKHRVHGKVSWSAKDELLETIYARVVQGDDDTQPETRKIKIEREKK